MKLKFGKSFSLALYASLSRILMTLRSLDRTFLVRLYGWLPIQAG
jgi:hypothetical protein